MEKIVNRWKRLETGHQHQDFVRSATVVTTTLSSRVFNQDTAGAKRAAERGPVVITDRGEPAHVLMTYEYFQALSGGTKGDIIAMLGMADAADIEFEAVRVQGIARPAEFD